VPGTAHGWGRWGGVAPAIVVYSLLEMVSMHWTLDSFLSTSGGLTRAWGLPPSIDPLRGKWHGFWAVDMPWFWPYLLVGAIVVIFALNAVIVMRSQRRKVDRLEA
jgi:hypothetical protein